MNNCDNYIIVTEIVVYMLSLLLQLITKTLDEIRVLIGDERFLRERCQSVYEGSGSDIVDDDDDNTAADDTDTLIDCSKYIDHSEAVEGSGDGDSGKFTGMWIKIYFA